ncbi:hypothetical protein IFR05_000364 [Cadophora sp. M221]|nr:hypothetical protein IFR05_000364 [Cadophora sp. M221]
MSPNNLYLLAYNSLSFLLWLYLTFQACSSLFSSFSNPGNSLGSNSNTQLLSIYHDLLPTLTITQSLAALEVLHAACGLVRASPVTTAIQVGGKNLVVWTVMRRFPQLVANVQNGGIWGFMGCVFAWGVSEMIRYGFFVVQIVRGEALGWMKWLRYSAFVVLYPPGFLSEAWLVYVSLTQAEDIRTLYRTYLLGGLLSYLPLGYILYSHMLVQRKRVLKPGMKKS